MFCVPEDYPKKMLARLPSGEVRLVAIEDIVFPDGWVTAKFQIPEGWRDDEGFKSLTK